MRQFTICCDHVMINQVIWGFMGVQSREWEKVYLIIFLEELFNFSYQTCKLLYCEGSSWCYFTNNNNILLLIPFLATQNSIQQINRELVSCSLGKASQHTLSLLWLLSEALVTSHFAAGVGRSLCYDVLHLSSHAPQARPSSCIALSQHKV